MAGGPPGIVARLRRVFIALACTAPATAFAADQGAPSWAVAAAVFGLLVLGWWLTEALLARPLDRLARDLRVAARDNPRHSPQARFGWAIGLGVAGVAVQARLAAAEAERDAALAAATARIEEQKRRLEAILLDLSEGVIVCGRDHQVLLFNQSAVDLVDAPHALGLGRPVGEVLSREPLVHHLERLERRPVARPERFVCGTTGGRRLLHASMALLAGPGATASGYVLSLSDASGDLDRAARLDRLLRTGIERQSGMLAALRAAVETLADVPELSAEERRAFERVLMEESVRLSEQNVGLAAALDELGGHSWPMAEIGTADLFALLARRMAVAAPPAAIIPAGVPDWVYADSLSLVDLLEHLATLLARELGVDRITAAVARAHGRVSLDLIWSGTPIAAGVLDSWLDIPFVGGNAADARAVLERHGTDCWSQAAGHGEALIRIPLPSAAEPDTTARRTRQMRPEFYDFDLANRPAVTDALRERRLRELSFVVFDVETTGLELSKGDEVVQIGAVRVVNGRVLPMETFDRLVNPGRAIPEASTRFHGVTDAAVRDKPPLAIVLPQFHRFADDAVLVAHNAAFDMTAIGRGAASCGIAFDNPVLDTLLISAWLDPDEGDHSLDGIAERLGIEITARHTALGDSLTAAAVLVRQFERLEQRGIDRFGQLAVAIDLSARLRQNRMAF